MGSSQETQGRTWVPWEQQPHPLSQLHGDPGPSIGHPEHAPFKSPPQHSPIERKGRSGGDSAQASLLEQARDSPLHTIHSQPLMPGPQGSGDTQGAPSALWGGGCPRAAHLEMQIQGHTSHTQGILLCTEELVLG